MRILPIVFIVVAVIGLNSPVLAQQAPGPEDLKASLVSDLPAYWRVDMVEIQASVNDGDEISPQFRQRFAADVASREDLYLLVDEIEPFKVVAAATPARKSYRLYGIGFSKIEKGRWSTRLEMKNSLRSLGQPQSMFKSISGEGNAGRARPATEIVCSITYPSIPPLAKASTE